jgi:signal transduction histidine kinase/ActR/RegA family two-component response regulator
MEAGNIRFQANPESIPFFVAVALSIFLAVFAWRRRRASHIAPFFAAMMVGEAAWALFEALELVIGNLEIKIICFNLRATGCVTMILSLLATVLAYTGHERWKRPGRFVFFCAPAIVLLVFAWTNDWHGLYWTKIENKSINGHEIAIRVYGIAFKLHLLYCYILAAVPTFLLAQAVFRFTGFYRAQAAVMLFGVLLPWIVNFIDLTHVFGFTHIDTAAMSFAVTGLAFLPGLMRFRLLDLTPVAWAVVVKGMNDPVVVFDRWARVVDLNPAASRLVGQASVQLLGREAPDAFSPWISLVERLKNFPEEDAFEIDGPDPEKTTCFDARVSRLGEDIDPAGWVLVLRDVTPQKRAALERDRMLREQAARAEAEATNIAKDRFLATLSHELRTPLTPVLATVTAMLSDPDTPESFHSVLEMIRRNVVIEARLIDDLLDLARIRRGSLLFQREVIDAHQLVHNVIDICHADLRHAKLELEIELLARHHHVEGDPIRMQQSLWNLIKNAIKFTPAHGRLIVRSRNAGENSHAPGTPDLVIEISDTGIGIDPSVLPRVFDVMEQGGISRTRRFGGLGLGLTISRSIVEHHGGRISAHSPGAGQGATFTIEIPTASAPAGTSRDRVPSPSQSSLALPVTRPLRILLVEDNRDTLNYLSRLLSLRGHHVHTAADMTSALQVASEAELHVIISDIELPDGSGLELMWALRTHSNIPAIALSGFGSAADIEQSHSAGFAIHLTKPVDFRRLEQSIQQLVGSATTLAVPG